MNSLQTIIKRGSSARWIAVLAMALLFALLAGCGPAHATGSDDEEAKDFWEALTKGKPTLNIRGRIELAEVGTRESSQAYTVRTRLGYGTRPWYGTMIYADMVNVAPIASNNYWNLVKVDNGRSPIADPKTTEVNQAFLKIEREDWLDSKLIGGRQRIKLDDDRFIGNVGWRQNEQTYDAAYAESSFNVDGLAVRYGYLGYIRRIFGNQDKKATGPDTLDWQSNSHIINASYGGHSWLKPAAFIYLLDLSNDKSASGQAEGFSSASYGFRATGNLAFGEKWKLTYGGSYAFQTEFGDNPVKYQAHYVKLDAGIGHSSLGTVSGGWEMLGSDDGTARFVTPLATLHKFNGWADVFLGNGGPAGLRDGYVMVAPNLPWKLKTKLIYHNFTADSTGASLGNEFDGSIGRSFTKHLDLLVKGAYFVGSDGSPFADTYRVWFDVVLKI